MKLYVGTVVVIVAAGLLVGCAAEPMTVAQACSAHKSVMQNAPRDTTEVEDARYHLAYYEDWSKRIDGALGDAFSDLAGTYQTVLTEGQAPVDDPAAYEFYETFTLAHRAIDGVCGSPW